MLILTRKLGEVIKIGEEITVRVVAIYGKQVRLGIDAPLTMEVHRQEVYDKIIRENKLAAESNRAQNLGELRKDFQKQYNDSGTKRALTLNKILPKEKL